MLHVFSRCHRPLERPRPLPSPPLPCLAGFIVQRSLEFCLDHNHVALRMSVKKHPRGNRALKVKPLVYSMAFHLPPTVCVVRRLSCCLVLRLLVFRVCVAAGVQFMKTVTAVDAAWLRELVPQFFKSSGAVGVSS